MEITTLIDIIKNSAALYPNNEAFKCEDVSITYKELDTKTSQLAKCLIDSGVEKGDRVGIYLNRCIETAIAIYGILKAGAAYVPLDFTAPHSRTRFLIDNCGIAFLVTSNNQKRKITSLVDADSSLQGILGVSLDIPIKTTSWDFIYKTSLENYEAIKVSENDLAYIMFTSGSTGAPKGIMHTHGSGLNYAKLSANLYQVNSKDRVANHAPINFDISTFGYFTGPLAGASTVVITDAYTKFPVSLANLMDKENLTIWYSVPLALIQILLSGALDKINVNALRWVLFGGEVFATKYLKELIKKWPNVTFSNVYGPAEVNQCTYYNINSSTSLENQIPIGKIWNHTDYKILDPNDNEVSKGNKGLLVINSITMMKGYWNNKELTEKSFYIKTDEENNKLVYYRTGDVVYENKDNDMIFVGRNDRQAKIRGFRIELDEIELVLLKHPSVKEASVIIVESENKKKELNAVILLFEDVNTTSKELISFCKTNLPVYSIPERIQIFNSLPKTSSGKIDRNVLKNNLITKMNE
ncbi:amino acid adenylation domain-containing protein [uncultured Algibacter sp.]|uniref:amino acid adenylation domain-containing protein n=1 Tax=uncultured Algibacter sp. TaxID=298659 RepID=UPI002635362C|nr:amino acid adenylation domain-containing protein [uncultured Algibacter sp.]